MKAIKFLAMSALLLSMAACGGNDKKAAEAEAAEENDFYATQPMASGIYDATYFDIKGKDARKGQFDGRVIASISPEQSAIFVYENGNRTKIKHLVMLDEAFAQNDSVYTAASKSQPVTLSTDSANYVINYIANNDTVNITFNQQPRSTYEPLEALQKIQEESKR